MFLDIWSQQSGYNLGTFQERTDLSIPLPLKQGQWDNVIFTVISGTLPPGMQITDHDISGYAFEVSRTLAYKFVIRASTGQDFADITLEMTINGPNAPVWLTLPGKLPVNPNNLLYVLDNTPIQYQLEASDLDIGTGSLKFWIKTGNGTLPDGLSITDSGLIHGITAELPSMEAVKTYGFDSDNWDMSPLDYGSGYITSFDDYGYDTTVFDFQSTNRMPRKLNRNYQFTVSVTDGIDVVDRTFIIFVVSDEFLRADNTYAQVGTGVFTADNTYLRAPYWLSPSDLGTKRANNYTMYIIETLDPNPTVGPVVYQLEPFNPDDSPSRLPSGMDIDELTGVVFGYSPYQPPITQNYTFTLSGTKYDTAKIEIVEVIIVTYGVAHRGQPSIKIYPLVSNDVTLLVGQSININDVYYTVNDYSYVPGSPFGLLVLSSAILTDLIDKTKIYRNFYIPTDTGTTVGMVTNQPALSGSTTLSIDPISLISLDLMVGRNFKIANHIYRLKSYIDNQSSILLTITPPLATNLESHYGFTNTFRTDTVVSYKTFTISLIGEIDSDIKWLTSSNLGNLEVGYDSTLSISAVSTITKNPIIYRLVSGRLPNSLSFDSTGLIIGKVLQYPYNGTTGLTYIDGGSTTFDNKSLTFDRSHTFTISASDGYSTITKTFNLTVIDPDLTTYTNITVMPYGSLENRKVFDDFISDTTIFDPSKLYRSNDPAFGLQKSMSMLFYAGIQQAPAASYIDALRTDRISIKYTISDGIINVGDVFTGSRSGATGEITSVDDFHGIAYFKMHTPERFITDETLTSNGLTIFVNTVWSESWRFRYAIGGPKLAVARSQGSTDIIYEIIYLEVFDRYEIDNTSVSSTVSMKNGLVYLPNSTTNLRNHIASLGLKTENAFLPLWMKTPQNSSTPATGFIKAIPLCYCQPGEGQYILSNINHSGFDFSLIDYDIDRYTIDHVTDYVGPLYLKLL